jgi:hypothetical protein
MTPRAAAADVMDQLYAHVRGIRGSGPLNDDFSILDLRWQNGPPSGEGPA